jgi:hypothetical protein
MQYKSDFDTALIADEYVKFQNFNNLYESYNMYVDKFLLASVVGCIEGNIKIDVSKKSWYIWFGQYQINYKLPSDDKYSYILFSIYEYMKNHDEYYKLIIKYYNLWHGDSNYENQDFLYDDYHRLDTQDNYKQLISIILVDFHNAENNLDSCTMLLYKKLYIFLTRLFGMSKICS